MCVHVYFDDFMRTQAHTHIYIYTYMYIYIYYTHFLLNTYISKYDNIYIPFFTILFISYIYIYIHESICLFVDTQHWYVTCSSEEFPPISISKDATLAQLKVGAGDLGTCFLCDGFHRQYLIVVNQF